jgi:hypothetical protein
LWLDASSLEAVRATIQTISHPSHATEDQLFADFKQWLQSQSSWLVVLDQIEDLEYIELIIPPMSSGHVLLTSRIHATGRWAQSFLVQSMNQAIGALLLLRRACLLSIDESLDQAPTDIVQAALTLTQEMSGMPLALDQAGAYLKETRCHLVDYLALYRTDPVKMLDQRGLPIDTSHPSSMTNTLLQVFERLSPDAREVLRLFTFYPSNAAIPSLLRGRGLNKKLRALAVAIPFAYHNALAELIRFSLFAHERPYLRNTMYPIIQTVCASMLTPRQRQAYANMAASLEQTE